MAQYQSFPGAVGDSRSLDKLKALHLPVLADKSFLDVGCNEGFFCGFAAFQGASRIVGIDRSQLFVERAAARFPQVDFFAQGWDELPDGQFDVILLASALHYADDQAALIRTLVGKLTANGVLVLELGVTHSAEPIWEAVVRGIDRRLFPSMPMLREVLGDYAWKWMGPSIRQDGDPVARQVIHVSRRRPLAYLLMQPPGYGKSSVAGGLFPKAGVPLISGDAEVSAVARGESRASPALVEAIRRDFSPYSIDKAIQRVFAEQLGHELIALLMARAGDGDVAIDVYVPHEQHEVMRAIVADHGRIPVVLDWGRIGEAPLMEEEMERQANAYYLAMLPSDQPGAVAIDWKHAGVVDEVWIERGRLMLRGWAVGSDGRLPDEVSIELGRKTIKADRLERQLRPDVQQALGLPHALVGYRLTIPITADVDLSAVVRKLKVSFDGQATNASNIKVRASQ
ncbi:Methyltransferase domain-containing protein [Pseudoxanthomonas sp. GM95]|uniref:class I SAM-dependent methyltransferase n=1 Tax=Pseudoxanthomonas sp. GM95 TaxID=1881043 RepID=UPI0008D4975A|nr:class I SAM-dependent methyltransferase [Pseudoxanthomonas sp. GM95]SEK42787.1 Methyltransferase domain-containing protein [Pseudoxanthomonas sp. GM95]